MRLVPTAIFPLILLSGALSAGAGAGADAGRPAALQRAIELTARREWLAADSLAAIALAEAAAQSPPDSATLALAHALRGNARLWLGRLQDSLLVRSLESALEVYANASRPDTMGWIRTHVWSSRVFVELSRTDDALAQLERSRALGSPALAGWDSAMAETWLSTGRTLRRARDFPRAVDALRRSLEIRERLYGPDDPRNAATLAEIGAAHMAALEFEEAGTVLERAVSMIERSRGPLSSDLNVPLGFLANLRHLLGDVAGSIEILDRQIAVVEAESGPDSPRLIPSRSNRATRFVDMGDYAAAIEALRPLVPIAEKAFGPRHPRTRYLYQYLGAIEAMNGDPEAEAHLAHARELHRTGPPDPDAGDALVARFQSLLLLRRGDARAALATADSALTWQRPSRLPVWWSSQLLEARLDATLALGDPVEIRATVAKLDSLAAETDRPDALFVATALRLGARALERLGEGEAAWARAIEAEHIERQRLRRNLRSLPDRHALQLADQLAEPLDLMLSLARGAEADRAEAAWDRLVRWRGMVRAEMAERRVGRDANADVVAAHAQWLELRRQAAQREVAASMSGDTLAARRLAEARAAAEQAERRMVQQMGGVRRDTNEVSLAQVRAALGARALVSIAELAPRSDTSRVLALVAANAAAPARVVDLGPRAALRPLLGAWREALAVPPAPGREREREREARRRGERVSGRTWALLEPHLGGAREVVVVADGDLAGLPWGALPAADGRYLVETGPTLVTLASERDLLDGPPTHGGALIAFGDPDFDAPAVAVPEASLALRGPLGACATRGDLALAPLPGARAEVEDVTRAWSGAGQSAAARLGAAATERAFKDEAPGARVLHIATHGIVWGDSCVEVGAGTRGVGGVSALDSPPQPRRPAAATTAAAAASPATDPRAAVPPTWTRGRRLWLALAGANRARYAMDANDGLLTADEVAALDLGGVDWVVLSACQSAAGEGWPREGSLGMQRAFWVAGARSVIASQWPIGDASTREWMAALYAARAAGAKGSAAAMQAASRRVLDARRAGGRSTHPFYWAAFTAQGE